MWAFHRNVYEWGFLVVLIGFGWHGSRGWAAPAGEGPEHGGARHVAHHPTQSMAMVRAPTCLEAARDGRRLGPHPHPHRRVHGPKRSCSLGRKGHGRNVRFNELVSQRCADAQNAWDDAIDGAWSLASLGLLSLATSALIFERPLADGRWPSSLSDDERRALEAAARKRNEPQSTNSAVRAAPATPSLLRAFIAFAATLLCIPNSRWSSACTMRPTASGRTPAWR